MSDVVIRVENLSKYYRLGLIGGGTLREDLQRWWAMARGRPDPLLQVGAEDHDNRKGGEVWALQDVSFDVAEGEVLGIIGRNGAGKSTLLKILSRITAPTSGAAKIMGHVGSLLEVGTGFHPELTGRENTYLNGAILGMKEIEVRRKFDEIVAFAEIERFIDTPVKRYSSGMYVRLAFAVAAYLEPEILIVDEVLAVGDHAFQKKCLGKMGDVARRGRTVLFVSHNMGMVQSLCGRVILLEGGRLVTDGEPQSVISEYSQSCAGSSSTSYVGEEDKTKTFQILGVRVVNERNEEQGQFDIQEAIMVKIKYVVRQDVAGMVVSLKLVREGVLLCTSFHTDYREELEGLHKGGSYGAEVEIPGSMLKPGNYSINVGGGVPNRKRMDFVEGAVAFQVESFSQGDSLKGYSKRREGLLALPLKWKMIDEGPCKGGAINK